MIKFEKMYASTRENPYNLDAYRIIKISMVFCNVYIIFKDKDKFVFYVDNYID